VKRPAMNLVSMIYTYLHEVDFDNLFKLCLAYVTEGGQ